MARPAFLNSSISSDGHAGPDEPASIPIGFCAIFPTINSSSSIKIVLLSRKWAVAFARLTIKGSPSVCLIDSVTRRTFSVQMGNSSTFRRCINFCTRSFIASSGLYLRWIHIHLSLVYYICTHCATLFCFYRLDQINLHID